MLFTYGLEQFHSIGYLLCIFLYFAITDQCVLPSVHFMLDVFCSSFHFSIHFHRPYSSGVESFCSLSLFHSLSIMLYSLPLLFQQISTRMDAVHVLKKIWRNTDLHESKLMILPYSLS